uniref:Uncharacterized protein n=1 Tax=Meloidogyne incognita TaxID=6306 RepID=A0A914KLZ4_MELIC
MIQSAELPCLLRPKKLDIRRLLLAHFHWKCLICSLLISFCSIHISYCQIYGSKGIQDALSQTAPGPCSHGYDLIPMALAGLLYAIYLSECWHYRTLLCIIPRMGASQAKDLASAMRDAVPIVWWKSTSYHYLRRTRRVIRYRNGDATTRIQVYYERVNSHQSGNVFLSEQCGHKARWIII